MTLWAFTWHLLGSDFISPQLWKQEIITHQLTPSASTQANLYSLTFSMSWRHPATHWTYWELCERQRKSFTKTQQCVWVVEHRKNKTSLEDWVQWLASETWSGSNTRNRPVQNLHDCHLSNPGLSTCMPRILHTTHARSQSSSTLPLHLSRNLRLESEGSWEEETIC